MNRQAIAIRVAPKQERSERRLQKFLLEAAKLFAEVGFDAKTMTAIRADIYAGGTNSIKELRAS